MTTQRSISDTCPGADWLALAATPVFALMALYSADPAASHMHAMAASGSAPWLAGMIPMYLLMSVFHVSPWFALLGRRQAGGRAGARH